jgi:hypothetical protein
MLAGLWFSALCFSFTNPSGEGIKRERKRKREKVAYC